MSKTAFFTIRVLEAQEVLPHLHEEVVRSNGRIELVDDGVDGASVIISKAELQSLETALAMLSDADSIHQLDAMLRLVGKEAKRAESVGV